MATRKESKNIKTKEFDIGCKLWSEKKYGEAEKIFREVVKAQEKILGTDHEDTVNSKYWLGCTLYNQTKHIKANELLQHVVYLRGRTLGEKHKDTLESKYYLGCTLNSQKRYSDAEKLFQTVIEGQQMTLGKEHLDTLDSKYQLGCVFYNHKRYSKAEELLQEVAQRWEKTIGKEHEDTLACKYWLGLALYNQAKYRGAKDMLKQAADGRERLLGIDHEETLETVRWLQECQIKPIQSHLDLAERFGWQVGAEKFLWRKEPALANKLITRRSLGEGKFGMVEKVIAQGSNEPMVRKRFVVFNLGGERATAQIQKIKGEIDSLRRLSHLHIVTILGCYQEEEGQRTLAVYVLMQPVGDNDLKAFMEAKCTEIEYKERSEWIKKWVVCLASALSYMHSKGVHHEDIKPGNIIHRGDHVFFTDFGSSRRLEVGDETSTTSEAIATRLFAAPEAFRNDDDEILSHGSKTDVFSLGLVFVELLVVLIRERIENFRNHVFTDYKASRQQYYRVSHKFNGFFSNKIESSSGDSALRIYVQCFESMLCKERKDRPSAKDVLYTMKRTKVFKRWLRCECARGDMEMEDSDSDSYMEIER